MRDLTVRWNQGMVTSRDPSQLGDGECQTADSVFYRVGDPDRAHLIDGRVGWGSPGLLIPKGIQLATFDDGASDRLVTYSGDKLYSRLVPELSAAHTSIHTFASSAGTHLARCHYQDRWYFCDGVNAMVKVKSDGVARDAGLPAPPAPPVITATNVAVSATYPTAYTNGSPAFLGPEKAYDPGSTTGYQTAAVASVSSPGLSPTTCTWHTWGSSTASSRVLSVRWRLSGSQVDGDPEGDGDGPGSDAGFNVTVLITYAWTDGVTPVTGTIVNLTTNKVTGSARISSVPIPGTSVNSSSVQVTASLTYNSGSSQGTLDIYDIRITAGAAVTAFTPTIGMYYAFSWYDQTNDIEGPVSKLSVLVTGPSPPTLAAMNLVSLDIGDSSPPTLATHVRIYRSTDGGTLETMGRILESPLYPSDPNAQQESFTDDFSQYDKDTQPDQLIPLKSYTIGQGSLRVPRNIPPPSCIHLNIFKGRMVGLLSGTAQNLRMLRFSEAGYPGVEYWPETNVIEDFPLQEHDQLVTTMVVGDSLIVLSQDLAIELTDVPDVVGGQFTDARANPLKGHPGCKSRYGATAYSTSGEPRGAWVSPFGIYETNGNVARRLTADIDWAALCDQASLDTSVLHWDAANQILLFAYDSDGDGVNDEYLMLHMAPEHQKANGLPKISRGYGKIGSLTSGFVTGEYWIFSTDHSQAAVYREFQPLSGSDGSLSQPGTATGTIVGTLLSGRIAGPRRFFAVTTGALRHSAAPSRTATVTIEMGRDGSATTTTASKTVALDRQEATKFYVGRSGDWMEMGVTLAASSYEGASILDARLKIFPQGES